ncbi:hypothetical protein JTE90_023725 [Oedothorax gibbosus]|uniref:sn-1-specific diacylglycerol lipase ABHD11 n=1 Tax=Oedothorax gibbosus TaxID=931172 RepID=A0AAV6VCS8_9ARAC|nr:hypothetical protein JTE90_023725 [Oedothorax gibbosus]
MQHNSSFPPFLDKELYNLITISEAMKLAYDLWIPKQSSKDLPPVILIHCLVETRKTWKTIGPEVAEKTGRKVYAIDCRNHGDSPRSEEHGSEILTEDLEEFLLQNGIEKAILVGHSLGGVVAMQFALKKPSKVEKLIIEDSLARRSEHRSSNFVPAVLEYIREAYANQPCEEGENVVYGYIKHFFHELAPMLKLPHYMLDTYDRELFPMKWNGQKMELLFNLEAIINAVQNDKLVKELEGTFEGESLFIFGQQSQFKVGQDHLILKHFPKALKMGFDKAGHFIHHVYTLDARNHGKSQWSDEMNFDVLTNDLEEFMTDHKIKQAILIGHSLGGRTAITLALKRPELVERLLVEDMNLKNYSSLARRSVQLILHIFKDSLSHIPQGADEEAAKKAVLEFIKTQLPPGNRVFDLDTIPLKREADSYAWEANLEVLEDMLMTEKCDQKLSGVYNREALFLYGTNSFFDVLGDDTIEKHFPAACKVPVEGAGHLIHTNYPEDFLKHVLNFVCPSTSK